jgi:predicted amidohydrolase YtcJ
MSSTHSNATLVAALVALGAVLAYRTPAAAPPQKIDAAYVNGKIITVDPKFTIAQAIGVADGRIVAVGSTSDVRALAGPQTQVLDLRGRTVLPGFYDAHVHVGIQADAHDWNEVKTFEELARLLRAEADKVPPGTWIQGRLKNEHFPEARLFKRRELDAVTPRHPVLLTRGAHVMILNSAAIEAAMITKVSKPAPGGSVELDATGEPTGVLRESAAWRLVWPHVPRQDPTRASAEKSLRETLDGLPALGITSINVAGVRPHELRHIQDLYDAKGQDLVRMTAQIRMSPGYDAFDDLGVAVKDTIREIEGLGFHTGFGNDRLKIGAIKMSIDGGLTGQGQWTIDGYVNRPDFHGLVRIPEQPLYAVSKRAHELGWQLGIHAIGDAAIQMTVDVLSRVLDEAPRPNHRHYMHHVSVMPPAATLQKASQHQLLICSQPNFAYALSPFAVSSLAGQKLETNNPQMSLVRAGLKLGYGGDGMPLSPLVGLYAAVSRKGIDGRVYGPGEKMSLEDAIRAYTMGSAYLTFDEASRGSLEVGKLADMVVLGEDILTVDPERIKDLRVDKTIVGGRVLYSRETKATH